MNDLKHIVGKSRRLAYKTILFIAVIMLPNMRLTAQINPIQVHVTVIQPVPPYLPQIRADILNNRSGQLNEDISSHLSVTLLNTGRQPWDIKLSGSIDRISPSPMGVSLRPDYQPSRPIDIVGGQMINLQRNEVVNAFGNFEENDLMFNNTNLETLRQNGVDFKLPEGTYRVCVTAYDYDKPGFSGPLSAPGSGCAYFTICYTASAPQILLPVSTMMQSNSGFQSFTPHSSQIQFTWTPPATTCGVPIGALTYNLEIRQVFEGQTVVDALNNPPVFEKHFIPTTTFLLDTLRYPHVLINGQKYIIRVKANFTSTPGSPLEIANQGFSQVGAFTYKPNNARPFNKLAMDTGRAVVLPGQPSYQVESFTAGCGNSAFTGSDTSDINLSGADLVKQDPSITIDNFSLTLDNDVQRNSDGSYQGTGYITWKPFNHNIELKVTFSHIHVNSQGQVYSGNVLTSMDGSFAQWAPLTRAKNMQQEADSMSGMNLQGVDFQNLENYINNAAHQVNEISGNSPVDMPLGINNTNLAGTPTTLSIMGIVFSPGSNSMNVVFNMNMPDANGWLSLAGICFNIQPQGFSITNGLLYLPQSHTVNLGGIALSFLPCTINFANVDTTKGTYVEWDQNGLQKIFVNADLVLPGNDIVPVDFNDNPTGGEDTLHAFFSFTDWNNWIASCSLADNFEIKGLPGFMISATSGIYYDHSLTQDVTGFQLPSNYVNPPAAGAFEGLFIPSLSMELPKDFSQFGNGSNRLSFAFNNFILDASGVTTRITGSNILDINTGDIGGWSFSIDNLQIGIVQNNIGKDGMQMTGAIRLPISNQDTLSYTCNLNTGGNGSLNYQFVITPQGQIQADIWKASLTLDGNSNFTINKDQQGMAINTQLNGSININISSSPKISFPALSFQNMTLGNRDPNTQQPGFYFNAGNWSLGGGNGSNNAVELPASSQEMPLMAGPLPPKNIGDVTVGTDNGDNSQGTISGFEVNLSNFKPAFKVQSSNEYELGVGFDVNVNIGFGDASVLSATTTLQILGKVDFNSNSSPAASFDKVAVDSVKLNGDLGPVTVNGALVFENDDPTYGDGIYGQLSAKFPFVAFNASARFGSINSLHYWGVGGSIFLQGAGVLIAPGITLNGFGGGIYHNMTFTVPDNNTIQNSTKATPLSMTPQAQTTGIQGELIVAVMTPDIANVSLTLTTQIQNGKLEAMQLAGDGYVITNAPSNTNYLAHAGLVMNADFQHSTFDTYAHIDLQFLTTQVHIPIWIHAGGGEYYFYIGRPDGDPDSNRISATIIKLGKSGGPVYVYLGANAYVDAGNTLPKFPCLPSDIQNAIIQAGGDKGSSNQQVSTLLQQLGSAGNPGFMFGASVNGEIDINLLFLYAKAKAEVGFDVALEKVQDVPSNCLQPDGSFGLNNWYAVGQLYAYLSLDVGIQVHVWFVDGSFSLMSAGVGAVLQAGLPNPTWGTGQVFVHGQVLGGLVTVNDDFPFSFGDQCSPPYDPLDNIQMITDAGPSDNAGVFDIPYVAFSTPMNGQDFNFNVPADSYHPGGPYTRTFHFYMDTFNLYKETANGDSLVAGYYYLNPDGLASQLYRKTMLDPYSKYKMVVGCYAKEVINGAEVTPREGAKSQDTILSFTTGAAPNTLVPQNIVYSYPIDGQEFLLKNEFGGWGQIKLNEWQGNLLPLNSNNGKPGFHDPFGYDYKLYFIPEAGGDTIITDFIPDKENNSLDFQIPSSLNNSTIYRMEVWVIFHRPSEFAIQNINTQTENAQVIASQQTPVIALKNGQMVAETNNDSMRVTLHLRKVHGINAGLSFTQPIYSLRFRTSQFNNFSDKINSYGSLGSQPEDNNQDIIIASTIKAPEAFDVFEIKGYKSQVTNGCSVYQGNMCTQQISSHYPPMFNPVIPYDPNKSNDQFISKWEWSTIAFVPYFKVDFGAWNMRDKWDLFPGNTVSTALMFYVGKLAPPSVNYLGSGKKVEAGGHDYSYAGNASLSGLQNIHAGIRDMANTFLKQDTKGWGYAVENLNSMSLTSGGYGNETTFGLPASYFTEAFQNLSAANSNSFSNLSGGNFITLNWKRDEIINADYQLMMQFSFTYPFIGQEVQSNLNNGGYFYFNSTLSTIESNPVAKGEYGEVDNNPAEFDNAWDVPSILSFTRNMINSSFSQFQFPPTLGRTIDFNYVNPFAGGNMISTVPEQFNYEESPPSLKLKIVSGLSDFMKLHAKGFSYP